MPRTLSAAPLAAVLLVGCGVKLPTEPPGSEQQRAKHAERDAREQAERQRRETVRAEAAPHFEAFRKLATRAKALVPKDAKPPADWGYNPAPMKGRVLIWDAVDDTLADAHLRLPDDVRLTNPADAAAVYLILKKDRRNLNVYFNSYWSAGQQGGKRGGEIDPTLAVVEFPAGKGYPEFWIYGERPTSRDAELQWDSANEIVGDWAASVAAWAEHAFRGTKPRRPGEPDPTAGKK